MADPLKFNEVPFEYEVVSPKGAPAKPKGAPAKPKFEYEVISKAPEEPGFWGTVADAGKSLAAGALRGAAGLADLPSDVAQLAIMGGEKLTGYEVPEGIKEAIDTDFREGMSDLTGGFSDRKAETTLGRYAGAIGEFIPGALAATATGGGSLVSNVMRGAVAPAVGSEFLGHMAQNVENPWVEPAARVAGAILGGIAGNKIENFARGVISPGGGADPARLAAAKAMREQGIPVTAGQATGKASILGAEADTAAGQAIAGAAPDSIQAKAFTAAAMKHIGSTDDLANPAALLAARNRITSNLSSSVAGVNVVPSPDFLSKVSEAAQYFKGMVPKVYRPSTMKEIIGRISAAGARGTPLSGQQLAAWRSNLGDFLYYGNDGISKSAYMLREAIDEAIGKTLYAMKQPQRYEAWLTARNEYRNLLAIEDALNVSKAAGVEGIITPKDLIASLEKQDKSALLTGRRGDIADLARKGVKIMEPLPRSGQHGLVDAAVRRVGPFATAGTMGVGALQGAQWLGLGPIPTALAATYAAGKPLIEGAKDLAASYSMNPTIQRYLMNQLVNSNNNIRNLSAGYTGMKSGIPSFFDERVERKAGGRVVINHDKIADHLVASAERAKKGMNKGTEQLLELPDDHIASALEVANRSI